MRFAPSQNGVMWLLPLGANDGFTGGQGVGLVRWMGEISHGQEEDDAERCDSDATC